LTPQQVEDLKNQIRTYCEDNDPRSLLNIGTLSLTKLKESFKIFKTITWEAKQNGGGGGSNSSGSGSNGPEKDEMLRQIKDLQGCLLQRYNEIAILVNMVKKGKTANDVQSAVSSAAGTRPNGGMGGNNKVVEEYNAKEHSSARDSSNSNSSGNNTGNGNGNGKQYQDRNDANNNTNNNNKPRPKSPSGPAVVQLAPKEEKLVQRHLFGIAPPENRKTLDDAGGEWCWCAYGGI